MPDLVTFGDSLPWGQGLLNEQKFPELVAQRLGLRHRMCAHSGARVLFHDDADEIAPPEVPFPSPTVLQQVEEYAGDPLEARIVLVNGGVNDVKVTTLISPLTSPRSLQNKIRRFCYEDMALLLQAVLRKFPHPDTRVVLTSYYPFFSPATDFAQLACFLTTFFILLPVDTTDEDKQGERNFILQRIVDNAQLFWTESTAMFRRVVAESGSPRVGFALVPFGDENAMFAADPWLFNVYWTGAGIHAEDPVAACRRADCDRFHDTAIERGLCYIASAGHPNVRGSEAYASTILALLEHWPA